jgi:hypothetical protein
VLRKRLVQVPYFLLGLILFSGGNAWSADLCKQLMVPQIRFAPYHDDMEYPIWAVSMSPDQEFAQNGGYDSFNYAVERVSEADEPEVVAIATERFKTAPGWEVLHDWLNERNKIASAPEYIGRKKTWMSRPRSEWGKPIHGSKVETTGGIVWGEFSALEVEGKSGESIYGNLKFRLPEEKTLKLGVTRYIDPDTGKGIAIELRALSKDPLSTPAWLRDEQMNRMIMDTLEVAKKYPKLYDKPIVSFYADPWHLEKYVGTEKKPGWLRANIQEETTPRAHPVFLEGADGKPLKDPPFWVCEVSPKTLEQVLMDRLKAGRTVGQFNLPHPFRLPSGEEAVALEGTTLAFDSEGSPTFATLRDRTRLAAGIYAAPSSNAWWVDQHLVHVDRISDPYILRHDGFDAHAPVGATLEWNSPYLLSRLRASWDDVLYRPNIGDFTLPYVGLPDEWNTEHELMRSSAERAAGRNGIKVAPKEKGFANELNRQARDYRRKTWGDPELTRIVSHEENPIFISGLDFEVAKLEISGDTVVFRMAKDAPLPREVELGDGLVATEGTDLELERTPHGWKWTRICLRNDAVVHGIHYRRGAVLVEIHGRVSELTHGLSGLFPYF